MTPEKQKLIELIFDLIRDGFIIGGFAFCLWLIANLQRQFSQNLDDQLKAWPSFVRFMKHQNEMNKKVAEFTEAQCEINLLVHEKTDLIHLNKFQKEIKDFEARQNQKVTQ